MSIETLPGPGKIAGFADLEVLARQRTSQVRQAFDVDMAQHGGVLGTQFRPNRHCQLYLHHMTQTLAPAVAFEPEPAASTERFVHAALKLGIMLASQLVDSRHLAPSTAAMRNHLESVDDFYDYSLGSPISYLQDNRYTLQHLLDRYAEPFAPQALHRARAVLLGGLALMQVDQRRYGTFIEQQAVRFRTVVTILDSQRTSSS